MSRRYLAVFAFIVSVSSARADTLAYTFGTVPAAGVINGPSGSTIGWGYTITNESATDWLVTTGLNAGLFLDGTPDGSYFDFPVVAPEQTVTTDFDLDTFAGLYGLTWDADAPVGFTDSGQFTLSAEWWTGDPSAAGAFIEVAADVNAGYSASVANVESSVPEPSSLALVLVGLGAAVALVGLKSQKGGQKRFPVAACWTD
jgi:hypothetical protein